MRRLLIASAAILIAGPFASAQQPRGPVVPVFQNSVPTMNAYNGRVTGIPPQYMNGGLPGSTVYVTPRSPYYPGSTYIVNNSNNGTQNPFGVPSGGFNGYTGNNNVFYMMMGGQAGQTSTNPFVSNLPTLPQTWANDTTGIGPNGQPYAMPPGWGGAANNPQFPQMINAPQVVGQANGFFPNQAPPVAQPVNQNNFGIQRIPGLNAPR